MMPIINKLNVTTTYFGDIDSGPEKFEMLFHLGRLVFRIQDGQLCKHSHVGPFQTESGLEQLDQLLEKSSVLNRRLIKKTMAQRSLKVEHLSFSVAELQSTLGRF